MLSKDIFVRCVDRSHVERTQCALKRLDRSGRCLLVLRMRCVSKRFHRQSETDWWWSPEGKGPEQLRQQVVSKFYAPSPIDALCRSCGRVVGTRVMGRQHLHSSGITRRGGPGLVRVPLKLMSIFSWSLSYAMKITPTMPFKAVHHLWRHLLRMGRS
jgi:hypothetical protein